MRESNIHAKHSILKKYEKILRIFSYLCEPMKGRTALNKKYLNGAGEEVRTLDIHLGKVTLYQLSYARICWRSALLTGKIIQSREHNASGF